MKRPAPPTSSITSLLKPNLVNATPLSDSEHFNFLNLPPPQPPSAHTTMPVPQAPLPHAAVSPAFASPLTGDPALGYSPTAAQVLAASTGSVGGGGVTPSNGPALIPTTVAALPAGSGTVLYGIPPVHRNTWGTSRSRAPVSRPKSPQAWELDSFLPRIRAARVTLWDPCPPSSNLSIRERRAGWLARHENLPEDRSNPATDIEYLTTAVKVACTKSGLGRYFVIMKDYTPAQVDAMIRTTFSSVPFDKYAYRFMELNRVTGSRIQPTGLRFLPAMTSAPLITARRLASSNLLMQSLNQSTTFGLLWPLRWERRNKSLRKIPRRRRLWIAPSVTNFPESVFANHERSCPGPPPSPKLAAPSRQLDVSRWKKQSPKTDEVK
ncbi:hypothetical protein FRC00_006328 [Tulasnella sp. 408]|nr:hypothetical protein FRC00_006328 [Tulasnella sp. 408]